MMRRQTLHTAIRHAGETGHPVCRAINGLDGCPVGGWGETDQAWRALLEALPRREERAYGASALVAAVLTEDHAGRYRRREGGV